MRTYTPKQAAKILNDQHACYCAGFYPSTGSRYFQARVKSGILHLQDWETWVDVEPGTMFRDHNGREIFTYNVEYTDTFGGQANYCWVRR